MVSDSVMQTPSCSGIVCSPTCFAGLPGLQVATVRKLAMPSMHAVPCNLQVQHASRAAPSCLCLFAYINRLQSEHLSLRYSVTMVTSCGKPPYQKLSACFWWAQFDTMAHMWHCGLRSEFAAMDHPGSGEEVMGQSIKMPLQ